MRQYLKLGPTTKVGPTLNESVLYKTSKSEDVFSLFSTQCSGIAKNIVLYNDLEKPPTSLLSMPHLYETVP